MNKGLIGNQVFHFHKCEPECQIDWQVHSIRKGETIVLLPSGAVILMLYHRGSGTWHRMI